MRPASVLALLLAAPLSAALAGDFDGPFLQAAIGASRTRTEMSGTGTPFDRHYADRGTNAQITVGYAQSFDRFNLAGNAFYVFGERAAGDHTLVVGPMSTTMAIEARNSWGLIVEPGFNLNPSALIYLKLGFVATDGRVSVTRTLNAARSTQTWSSKLYGYAYGAGIRIRLNEDWSANAELLQADFVSDCGNCADIKPSSLTAAIALTYRF